MRHKLFLTTRQKTKIRNTFAKNLSTDIKRSKAQISKIIQSDGSFSSWLGNFDKKVILNYGFLFARDKLPGLVSNIASNAASNAINKFERKISGKGAVTAREGFTLFISNEDMNDLIKIVTSLKNSEKLIDGVTEAVKDEIKKRKGRFFLSFVSTFGCFGARA